jgi:hypothetical protein
MARSLGFNRETVGRWRRGGYLRLDSAERCADALGVHPLEIWPDYHEAVDPPLGRRPKQGRNQ